MDIKLIIQQVGKNFKLPTEKEVSKYLKIKEFYENNDLNNGFETTFVNFYGLRYMAEDVRTLYFNMFKSQSKEEFDIKQVLEELYKKGNRIEFSFATKMWHTLDNNIPIYDNNIAKIFGFSVHNNSEVEIKIARYLYFLEELKVTYNLIINEKLLNKALLAFDENLPIATEISLIKKIDFIFWKAGS
jgi:hypothetical protein